MDKYIGIWDFDSPIYAVASIGDKAYIEAVHKESGRVKEFKNVTEFWGKGKAVGGWLGEQRTKAWNKEDFDIVKCTRRNPVITMDKMKSMIVSQVNKIEGKDWCEDLKLVVGGKGNYRFDIYSEYKSNRKDIPRPSTLAELVDWTESEYDVIREDGIEADDVLGIFADHGYRKALKSGNYKDNNICGIFIDKDILQFPGWYFNPSKNLKAPLWQTETAAAKCFWLQMLSGDKSDNIPGLPMVSPEVWKSHKFFGKKGIAGTRAFQLLEDCKKPLDMEEKVLYLYQSYWEQEKCWDWKANFQMNYQLLKLMSKKGVIPRYEF